MPRLIPASREQLDAAVAKIEEIAEKLRAANPNTVYLLDVNHEVDYAGDPFAADPVVLADTLTVRVEWIKEPDRG